MEQTSFTERLMEFGLTRQEASIYQCLLTEGKVTGYEVAKQTGISRSNAYNSLASMTEKGAAYLVEEASTRKYVPVPLNEFARIVSASWKNPQDGCRNICHRKKHTQKDILRSKAQRIY